MPSGWPVIWDISIRTFSGGLKTTKVVYSLDRLTPLRVGPLGLDLDASGLSFFLAIAWLGREAQFGFRLAGFPPPTIETRSTGPKQLLHNRTCRKAIDRDHTEQSPRKQSIFVELAAMGAYPRGDARDCKAAGFACKGGNLNPCSRGWRAFLYLPFVRTGLLLL